MSYLTTLERIQRVKQLAEREATGSLSELSVRLGTSRSTTKRLIKSCREQGVPIVYCRRRNSYVIHDNGSYEIQGFRALAGRYNLVSDSEK